MYLIPNVLHEDDIAYEAIPHYVLDAIKDCQVFFAENEKVARRFFKKLWKEMQIDDYRWYAIHKAEDAVKNDFISELRSGANVGIISDAGCPGIADPGRSWWKPRKMPEQRSSRWLDRVRYCLL